jgi:hypothetical protein
MTRYTFITVILLFLVCLTGSGQIDSAKNKEVRITLDCRPPKNLGDPIFILSIEKQKAIFTNDELFHDSLKINPDWIKTINVMKGQEALGKYGASAQYGAILIELKKESFGKLPAAIKSKFGTEN